jgi:hypothetical protein
MTFQENNLITILFFMLNITLIVIFYIFFIIIIFCWEIYKNNILKKLFLLFTC